MLEHLDTLYLDYLKHDHTIVNHKGPITQSIIVDLINTIEKNLEDAKQLTVNNVSMILAEQLHNIMNYAQDSSHEQSEYQGNGITSVYHDLKIHQYCIKSANIVSKEKRVFLENKLSYLNNLKPEELKKYFKRLRKTGWDKHERGAGLGFIDMLKKSKQGIDFTFYDIDDSTSIFEIQVFLDE
jgi:hypothetical protein